LNRHLEVSRTVCGHTALHSAWCGQYEVSQDMGQIYIFDSAEPMKSKMLEIQSKQELKAEVMPQHVNPFV
jgi:hypothetical protein